jgi:hypothetical protein
MDVSSNANPAVPHTKETSFYFLSLGPLYLSGLGQAISSASGRFGLADTVEKKRCEALRVNNNKLKELMSADEIEVYLLKDIFGVPYVYLKPIPINCIELIMFTMKI